MEMQLCVREFESHAEMSARLCVFNYTALPLVVIVTEWKKQNWMVHITVITVCV